MSSDAADAALTLDHTRAAFDVWRAAHLLIEQHGQDAQHTAAFLATARKAKGDPVGERVWLRVMMAVRELKRIRRKDSEHLN